MKSHYNNAQDFAKDVVKNCSGAWVNGTYDVNGQMVGIKAFGKWVQLLNG